MASMEVDSPATAAADPVEGSSTCSMEQDSKESVMAPSGTQGSVSMSIHPLVIMNISEHFTRVRAQAGKAEQVMGAIIGKQKGRHLELMNSFEIFIHMIEGKPVVDNDFFNARAAQYKEVFSTLELLGWYTTGDLPTESDVIMHKQMATCEANESPVLLKLNTLARNSENLPIKVFESVIDIVHGQAKMLFIQLPYTLVTEEAERIGVDHVARISRASSAQSSMVTDQLIAEFLALKMLHSRVHLMLRYVEAVQTGHFSPNHEILREIKSLCCRLPVLNTQKFRDEFYYQCNDVTLVSYLGALTKTCDTLNQLVNKLNVLQESRGGFSSKRMKGMLI